MKFDGYSRILQVLAFPFREIPPKPKYIKPPR